MENKPKEVSENWTIIVKPSTNWFDLQLKDVWRYRDLMMLFVKRDFVSIYKQTVLGPMWFFIQPLLTTIMFMVVFGSIAKIPTDGIPSPLFYLSGLTVWNYFATSLNKTSGTFITNAGIFGKVYFPRLVSPISMIISSIINFCFQFLLFILFISYFLLFKGFQFHLSGYLLLIPVLIVIMGGLALGFGIIISSLTTKYRDLSYLVNFGIQLFMYLTPVVYPLSIVGGRKRLLILANPMTSVTESFRYAFFPRGEFQWKHLEYSFVFMLVFLFIGIILFNKTEKNFMDTV
ncbi:MAG TPA: ABC transporter permease [Bacteroidia bacterium]|jgi:lipopolysaccharide transport system permease protein|nr:ABC transporter permease [Bacteroidia bacterium]